MVLRDPHSPTLAVRRAALASVAVAVAFELIVLARAAVPALHDAAAWGGTAPSGPLDGLRDALVGLAVVVVALLALPTWLRATVHGGPVPAPPHAVRALLVGSAGTLVTVSVAVVACLLAAVARLRDLLWDVASLGSVAVLGGLVALVAVAARWDGAARVAWRRPLALLDVDAARPDVLDDVATLAARWWPGSVQARTAAWAVRGLDVWSWSPRRHRTTFVGAAATAAGTAWTAWQVTRGPWASPLSPVLFAGLTAAVVAAALAAAIAWLGLLRPAPTHSPG